MDSTDHSAAITLRSVLLVVVMVAVPLVAVVGTPLPEVLRRALGRNAESSEPMGSMGSTELPRPGSPELARHSPVPSAPPATEVAKPTVHEHPATVPAEGEAGPWWTTRDALPVRSRTVAPPQQAPTSPADARVGPVELTESAPPASGRRLPAMVARSNAALERRLPAALPNADPQSEIIQRLQQLGATDFALEQLGAAGEFCRFRCRAPAAGQAATGVAFESTDSDPLKAMRTVLRDVERSQTIRRY